MTNPADTSPCDGPVIRCFSDEAASENSLSTLMLVGWFNDQQRCAEMFLESLQVDVREGWTTGADHLAQLKSAYSSVSRGFGPIAKSGLGEHKRAEMLGFGHFAWWATCVFNASQEAGSLDALVREQGTVESAHERFKPWFVRGGKTKRPRILNAADAARLLADAGYLTREARPLLARGALRGAAITVDDANVRSSDAAEDRYPDEESRRSLEERAARFAVGRWGASVRMDYVENWFCESVHKRTR